MASVLGFALCLDYEAELPSLRSILAAAGRTRWEVEDIDWAGAVGPGDYGRYLEWHGVFRSEYARGLSTAAQERLARQLVAFDYSQILHGEQGAMMLAGQLTSCLDDLDARLYAANQARDEARHVVAVRRLIGRLGPIYPISPALHRTVGGLLEAASWPKQVLGLQLFLEARALLAFRQTLTFVDDAVFSDTTRRIEVDESQHVAFGIRYMQAGLAETGEEARIELRDFALWLDENVWRMTLPAEYRPVFEECDLDFDAFLASHRGPSPYNLTLGSKSKQTVERMHDQFKAWFYRALFRTGILRAGESARADAWGVGTTAPEPADREVLPWTE